MGLTITVCYGISAAVACIKGHRLMYERIAKESAEDEGSRIAKELQELLPSDFSSDGKSEPERLIVHYSPKTRLMGVVDVLIDSAEGPYASIPSAAAIFRDTHFIDGVGTRAGRPKEFGHELAVIVLEKCIIVGELGAVINNRYKQKGKICGVAYSAPHTGGASGSNAPVPPHPMIDAISMEVAKCVADPNMPLMTKDLFNMVKAIVTGKDVVVPAELGDVFMCMSTLQLLGLGKDLEEKCGVWSPLSNG